MLKTRNDTVLLLGRRDQHVASESARSISSIGSTVLNTDIERFRDYIYKAIGQDAKLIIISQV